MEYQRYYSWLNTDTGPLFSCLHQPTENDYFPIGIVLCYPLGHEYTHSHSSMVAMADKMATAGFPCMRVDYHGTGDSSGDLNDPNRVDSWISNIECAVKTLKETAKIDKVCILGLRMGATLAALYSKKDTTDFLILWNPCIRGDAFIRDMQVMDQYNNEATNNAETVEFGGFVTTQETLESYKKINLNKIEFGAKTNNLIIHKSGTPPNSRLVKALTTRALNAEETTLPDYAEMMRQPQFSIVANTTIDYCCDWLKKQCQDMPTIPYSDFSFIPTQAQTISANSIEKIETFGNNNNLFGILTQPDKKNENTPIFVIANTGAAHHVGANRLHVELCRSLAKANVASFRFDLKNLGDSAHHQPSNLNHPYPDHSIDDLTSAIAHLQKEHDYKTFILGGLCSGANVAFHGSLTLTHVKVSKAILVNPLIFYWEAGLSLATPQRQNQQIEKKYYAQSAKSLDKWLKLIKGDINIKALLIFLTKQVYHSIWTRISNQLENFGLKSPTKLGLDLTRLASLNRPLDLILSESDPGYNIFLAEGRITAKKKLKENFVTVQFIPNADHTFTTTQSRQDLIKRIVAQVDS